MDPFTLKLTVNGQLIRSTKTIIATGASASSLPINGLEDSGYLTVLQLWQQKNCLKTVNARDHPYLLCFARR